MRGPIFRGKVERGRIVLDNRNGFQTHLASFEGKRVELILRERTAERSDSANKYYHGVVVAMLADHLGYTKQEMHATLKEQFGIVSTTKLTIQEMQDYITQVIRFAATEFQIYIPDPDSVEY
jgi:hypothetical protein